MYICMMLAAVERSETSVYFFTTLHIITSYELPTFTGSCRIKCPLFCRENELHFLFYQLPCVNFTTCVYLLYGIIPWRQAKTNKTVIDTYDPLAKI